MASLLGWLGNGAKRLENTVNNDVVKPIQRDVIRPVQGAVAQVNPLDNNRTYNTVAQHGASYAPAPPRSVASQIYHSAPANLANSIVKPFVATGADVSNTIGNAEVNIAHGLGLAKNVHPQTNVQQFGNRLGGYVGENTPKNFGKNVAQVGLNVVAPGASKVASKAFESVLPKVVPKLVSHAVANAGVGAPIGGAFNSLNGGSFKQGAQAGALLGAGGTVAPELVKGAVKVAKPAVKVTAQATQKAVNPQTFALNQSYSKLKTQLDQANSQNSANAIRKQMMANRAEYGKVKNDRQGGFVKIPGGQENLPQPASNGKIPQPPKVPTNKANLDNAGTSKVSLPVNKPNVPEDLRLQAISNNRLKTLQNPGKNGMTGLIGADESARELGLPYKNESLPTPTLHNAKDLLSGKVKLSNSPVTQPTQGANPAASLSNTKLPKTQQGSQAIPAPKLPSLPANRADLPKSGNRPLSSPGMKNNKLVVQDTGKATSPLSISEVPLSNNTPITPQLARQVGKQLTSVPETPAIVKPPIGAKPLGVVKTVATSQETTPKLSNEIQGSYNPLGNKKAMQAASERIAKDPNDAYHFAVMTHSAEGNATAIQLAKQLEAQGQPEMAANLMVQKAQQALQAGQGNQIYSLWDKLSPETVAQTAAKTIAKYNETARSPIPQLTAEQYQGFVNQAKHIQSLPEGSRAKGVATQNLLKDIGHLVPSKGSDKAFAIYRTGLLTGLRTPGKIIASHGISSGFEQVKNIPARAADIAIGAARTPFKGKFERGLTLTPKGNLSGGWHGALAAVDNLFTGYDKPGTGGFPKDFANDVHFSNTVHGKIAQGYVNTISRLHGSLYKPFYGAQHLNSLYDMATTNAKNAGLKGAERNSYIQDFVKKATDYSVKTTEADPRADFTTPEGAALRANAEAQYTTFQNKTKLSEMASGLKSKGGGFRYVAPFTQIPSSIAMKIVDYSPVGPIKEAISQVHAGTFDQRALSQAIGRGATGTGIMALGYTLFNKGMMTTAYPTDPKTQAQWKLEGKQANSILVGGKWRQLGSLGPSGDALAVGGNFAQGMQGNKKTPGNITNAFIQGGVGGAEVISNSPYLQGVQNVGTALSSPGTKTQKLVEGLAGGAIPTGIANVASATDPLQRQTNSVKDAVTNKLPHFRENNLPQVDALGNNIQRAQGVSGSLFDPLYSTTAKNNLVIQELNRTGQTPVPLKKNESFNGQSTNLTPQQVTQLNQQRGQTSQSLLTQTLASPAYKNLSLDQQQQMLGNILSDSSAASKEKYAAANLLGQYSPTYTGKPQTLTQKQQNIIEGNFNPEDYVPKQAKSAAYTTSHGVRVKAPKTTRAKSAKVSKAKTGRKSSGAPRTSLASYLKTVRATNPKPIKTPKAPSFSASKGAKYKSISLHQYKVNKNGVAHISHSRIA